MQNSPPCKANFCSASSRGKKPNTPMFLIFSGRCQKCHFSFHIITQESGFSVFHYETKTQFILRLANLKGLAKVNDYEKQPGVYLQDTEMHQASNSLCNRTCSLTLSHHLESTMCWWHSSFGILQVLSETFSCLGHPGEETKDFTQRGSSWAKSFFS